VKATPRKGIPPPLEGIRVLDLSTALAGPSSTMYLGDLGYAGTWPSFGAGMKVSFELMF
jgi:hypothetical protein